MKPVIVNIGQRSQEWHDWRNGVDLDGTPRITATAAVTIYGKNPYQTPRKLFDEMTGVLPRPDLSDNPNVKRGVDNEHLALAWAEEQTGRPLADVCVQHPEYPMFAASLDGGDLQDGRIVYVAELKCPTQKAMDEIRTLRERHKSYIYYSYQVQWQMFCSMAKDGALFFYDVWQPDLSVVLPVIRDESTICQMVNAAKWFRASLKQNDYSIFQNARSN